MANGPGAPGRGCCNVTLDGCLYFSDAYSRTATAEDGVNVEGSTRYSLTTGDWVITAGELVCVTADAPIYFKYDGDPVTLKGQARVAFNENGDTFSWRVGGTTYTLTRASNTTLSIDGVTFNVSDMSVIPWVTVAWDLPIMLSNCLTVVSASMPYVGDPLNEDCPAYKYDTHFLTIAVSGQVDPIISDVNKFQVRVHDLGDCYIAPVTITSGSFTSYGFSAAEGVKVDNLYVTYVRQARNEIQKLIPSVASPLGSFKINGIETAWGQSNVQAVLDILFPPVGFDYPTEVTEDGDDLVIEWINHLAAMDMPALVITDNFLIDEEDDPVTLTVETVQNGDGGCCSALDRPCYHICYPDGMPDEIHLTLGATDSGNVPCVTSLASFLACINAAKAANDCEALPYSTTPEKDARCACWDALKAALDACFEAVFCGSTCPAGDYGGNTYILDRKTPLTRDGMCLYECEVAGVAYLANTGEDEETGVRECTAGTTAVYTFRFSTALVYFDCESHEIGVTISDVSDYPLFLSVNLTAVANAGIFCGGGLPVMSGSFPTSYTTLAVGMGAFCTVDFRDAVYGREEPYDPEEVDPIDFCGGTTTFVCGDGLPDGSTIDVSMEVPAP
jgi:hypothetical protein